MHRASTRNPTRALVLAPFFSGDGPVSRPRIVGSALAEMMPVDVVTSDFDHAQKETRAPRQCAPFANVVYLHASPYRSNVSLARMVSHLKFSFRAAAYFRKNRGKYDVVYATVPLNVMAWLVFGLARGKTTIVDVVDIWPDVLPFPPLARKILAPLFAAWKWFFKSAVSRADIVMAVSDSFIEEAAKYARETSTVKRFYIGHARLAAATEKQPIFTIAYVGNLGRLYDFETLLDVMAAKELRDRVQLFVIGKGDRQKWLIEELQNRKLRYEFFGTIYDHERLARILRSCHIGFNGYINTSAAFSYKANTYLAAGLPLLNSMTGDLMRLVAEHGLGENYEGGNREQLMECLLRLIRNGTSEVAASCERFFASHLESSKIHADMSRFFELNLPMANKSILEDFGQEQHL
jgi:glycosyltransferase involved in cell wall biosynthesis